MSSSSKMIVLQSSDREKFEVEEAVALESETIKFMIEDECVDSVIPAANVTGNILAMVIEYCKRHVEANKSKDNDDDIKAFDANFIKHEDATLFNLILAANYLNIKGLLNITCQAVTDNIKDKTVEQVRKTFNIENDFTPEEEVKIREENLWAFE